MKEKEIELKEIVPFQSENQISNILDDKKLDEKENEDDIIENNEKDMKKK